MKYMLRRVIPVLAGTAWMACVAFGAIRLWKYEAATGDSARAPLICPAEAPIVRTSGLPTLVLLLHPHCPCSRATIGELAKLMTNCNRRLVATVLVLHPAGMPDAWVHTDLWSSAAAIPGVTVLADKEGAQARRFGAATSGQALLYSTDGRLLFAGGITESRGHSGDNAGRSAIESLVLGTQAHIGTRLAMTPVYGCSLFGPDDCGKEGADSCQR